MMKKIYFDANGFLKLKEFDNHLDYVLDAFNEMKPMLLIKEMEKLLKTIDSYLTNRKFLETVKE